jgi:hypothetical protein
LGRVCEFGDALLAHRPGAGIVNFTWTSARNREATIDDILDTIGQILKDQLITPLPPTEKRHEIVKRL